MTVVTDGAYAIELCGVWVVVGECGVLRIRMEGKGLLLG